MSRLQIIGRTLIIFGLLGLALSKFMLYRIEKQKLALLEAELLK